MEQQLEKILDQYDFSEKAPIIFIRESSDNVVYSVGEKDRKILRVSKRLPLDDVKFEFEAMEHLSGSGVTLPAWIKTKAGNFYASTPEMPIVVAFEFLEGVHAERTKDKVPTIAQAREAGKALGLLHNSGRDFSPSSPRSRSIFSELERALIHKKAFIDEFEGGPQYIAEVKEALEFAKNHEKPRGFIHNDYRIGNVFFEKKDPEKIKGVIDFDWGCIGPLSKDLALAVMEWSFADGAQAPDAAVIDSFLDGYNSVADFKIKKNDDLYMWMWFSGLSDTATWLCDNLTEPDFVKRVSRSFMYKKGQFFKGLVKIV